MKVTVIGSHLCPDTLEALSRLTAAGADYTFQNILGSHEELKAYLNLRDNSPLYADIRGSDRLGVPCFVCENGEITMDLEAVLHH